MILELRRPRPFNNWFESLDYLHQRSKEIIDDLLMFKDYLDTNIVQCLVHIDDIFQFHINIRKGRNDIGNKDMEYFSHGIHDYICEANKLHSEFKKYSNKYSKEYHRNIRKNRANSS